MTIEDAIKFFEKHGFRFQKQDTAVEALKQPEIVLCKDCKFREECMEKAMLDQE